MSWVIKQAGDGRLAVKSDDDQWRDVPVVAIQDLALLNIAECEKIAQYNVGMRLLSASRGITCLFSEAEMRMALEAVQ